MPGPHGTTGKEPGGPTRTGAPAGAGGPSAARVDRWLSAVRLFKTRAAATEACAGGHVKVNGAAAKASTLVRVGDEVSAQVGDRRRVVEVARVIEKRVGAPVAAGCLIDHSPPEERTERLAPVFARDRGAARPTKRDRRQLDRLRSRHDGA